MSNIVNFAFAIPLRTLIIAQVHKESLNWPLDRKISNANLSNVFVTWQLFLTACVTSNTSHNALCVIVDVVFLIKKLCSQTKNIHIYIYIFIYLFIYIKECARFFVLSDASDCEPNLRAFSIIRFKPLTLLPYSSPAGRKTMGFGCHVRLGNGVVAERAQLIDDFVSFFCDLALRMCLYCCKFKRKHFRPKWAFCKPIICHSFRTLGSRGLRFSYLCITRY